MRSNQVDLTGAVFGRLRVIRYGGQSRWHCLCDCGAAHVVKAGCLRNGRSKSCGCYNRERSSLRMAAMLRTHGRAGSSEYRSWCAMIARCENHNNVKFPIYGGRGITICARWRQSFAAFFADIGLKPSPTHSLDRINPDGNYEPCNCRWATPLEQRHNRRVTA